MILFCNASDYGAVLAIPEVSDHVLKSMLDQLNPEIIRKVISSFFSSALDYGLLILLLIQFPQPALFVFAWEMLSARINSIIYKLKQETQWMVMAGFIDLFIVSEVMLNLFRYSPIFTIFLLLSKIIFYDRIKPEILRIYTKFKSLIFHFLIKN